MTGVQTCALPIPVWPPGTPGAAGDALAVLGALHQQMPGRWPVVAGVRVGTTEWERPARLKLAA